MHSLVMIAAICLVVDLSAQSATHFLRHTIDSCKIKLSDQDIPASVVCYPLYKKREVAPMISVTERAFDHALREAVDSMLVPNSLSDEILLKVTVASDSTFCVEEIGSILQNSKLHF